MEQDQIQSAIKSLLVSTTETISREGVTPSLTGPIERGDIGVIRGHLEAMGDYDEEVEQLYRKIGKKTIPIALDKGAIDAHKAKIIFELLEQRQR